MSPSVKSSNTSSNHPSRSSRRWTPLVYPRSALVPNTMVPNHPTTTAAPKTTTTTTTTTRNQLFPLHWAVLSATVRELLVLDGTLDSQTLSVVHTQKGLFRTEHDEIKSRLAPLFHGHLQGWTRMQDDNTKKKDTTKKKKPTKSSTTRQRRGQKRSLEEDFLDQPQQQQQQQQQPPVVVLSSSSSSQHPTTNTDTDATAIVTAEISSAAIITAEEIVQSIVARCTSSNTTTTTTSSEERPPRKVSNADSCTTTASQSLVDSLLEVTAWNDLTKFVTLELESNNRVLRTSNDDLPAFLEVGICTETKLREICVALCRSAFTSFDTPTLGAFLGYQKSNTGKNHSRRDAWIADIAHHLFHVSHAMFAWQQLEQEEVPPNLQTTQKHQWIQQALFGDNATQQRAMETIGGFQPYSLLPQALSIVQLAGKSSSSWSHFVTTTPQGNAMVQHLQNPEQLLTVGQTRRPRRKNRSSSSTRRATTTTKHNSKPQHIILHAQQQQQQQQPKTATSPITILQTTLNVVQQQPAANKRPKTESIEICLERDDLTASWGVSLLCHKSNNTVVVGRAAAAAAAAGGVGTTCVVLQKGDCIVAARNETGQATTTTTSGAFFPSLVQLFQTSRQLHLQVQRRSCCGRQQPQEQQPEENTAAAAATAGLLQA